MPVRGPYDSKLPSEGPISLGQRIRALRVSLGLTQADLARAIHADQTLVSHWERDRITPSGVALLALAAALGTSPNALQTGENFLLPDPAPQAASSGKPRMVALPPPETPDVVCLDLARQDTRTKDIREAMMVLLQASKEGRKVWLVME